MRINPALPLVIVTCAIYAVIAHSPVTAKHTAGSQGDSADEPKTLSVEFSEIEVGSTMVAQDHRGAPPWPRGNCTTIGNLTGGMRVLPAGRWTVLNLHNENLNELKKRLGLKSLELVLLKNGECLVVDRRVPREWLLAHPCRCCTRLEHRLSLREKWTTNFRGEPQADALIGTTWELVSREDHDNLIENHLPGKRLTFGRSELACLSDKGEKLAGRLWEQITLRRGAVAAAPFALEIYDVKGARYTSLGFAFDRQGDVMTLTVSSRSKRNERGGIESGGPRRGKAKSPLRVRYRLVRKSEENAAGASD